MVQMITDRIYAVVGTMRRCTTRSTPPIRRPPICCTGSLTPWKKAWLLKSENGKA